MISACILNIVDGRNIHAWEDNWLEIGKNLLDYQVSVPEELEEARVCDLVDSSRNWNWNLLKSWMSTRIMQKMKAILPPNNEEAGNELTIDTKLDGTLAVEYIYQHMCPEYAGTEDEDWKRDWNMNAPERVKSSMWLLKHDKLIG